MAGTSVYYKKMMANLTVNENETEIGNLFCSARLFGVNQKILFSAFNILLSIVAFLGNVVIIFALQKPSSLHPSSKLLFGCLAITDLCVGLITQPLRVTYLMSPANSKLCYYARNLHNTLGLIFWGVSLLTLTAISIDRLLALMSGLRYRHVVTLRRVRVIVVSFWLSSIAILSITCYIRNSTSRFLVCTATLLCIIIPSCSYTKIYLTLRKHQTQLHLQSNTPAQQNGSSSGHSKRSTPLNIARYKKSVSSALWVQVTLVACCLPFGIVMVIFAITGVNTTSLDLAWEATILVAMLNSAVNPFLYCWKMKEIRLSAKDSIDRFC